MTGDGTGKTYEMLWNCEYCGAGKLLGKTHRHCPECGAAQDPGRRYFPQDSEKVAVEDHQYVGADLRCPACAAPNSARAKFCAVCGAPLDGASQVSLVADTARAAPAPPSRKGGGGKVAAIVVGGIVLVIVAAVLVLVLWTRTEPVTVTGHTWQREVKIESFAARPESEWCDRMPADAYGITRTSEIRSYNQIPDGRDCKTVRKDRGDGTFSEQQECTTRYRKEPVYDQKCRYTVDRWGYSRSVTAAGRSLAEPPAWPQVALAATAKKLGAEREGQRVETYTVHLVDAEGAAATCDYPEANWRAIADGSSWDVDASVVTGSIDCATLRPRGGK